LAVWIKKNINLSEISPIKIRWYIDIDIVLLKQTWSISGHDGSNVHVCLTSHYKLWETYIKSVFNLSAPQI